MHMLMCVCVCACACGIRIVFADWAICSQRGVLLDVEGQQSSPKPVIAEMY